MSQIVLIGLGGFAGAVLRYSVSGLVQNWSKSASFPYGTLAVNLIGCFLIGALTQLAESRGVLSPETRSLLFIGILGSFTTFSTFGNETMNLVLEGQSVLSLINIGIHLILGLGSVWLGRICISAIWG